MVSITLSSGVTFNPCKQDINDLSHDARMEAYAKYSVVADEAGVLPPREFFEDVAPLLCKAAAKVINNAKKSGVISTTPRNLATVRRASAALGEQWDSARPLKVFAPLILLGQCQLANASDGCGTGYGHGEALMAGGEVFAALVKHIRESRDYDAGIDWLLRNTAAAAWPKFPPSIGRPTMSGHQRRTFVDMVDGYAARTRGALPAAYDELVQDWSGWGVEAPYKNFESFTHARHKLRNR